MFSRDGLTKIALFSLPVILYSFFGRKLFAGAKAGVATRCTAVVMLLLCYGAGLLVVYGDPVLKPAYTIQYNYQSAVGHFGLLTGIRLDIAHLSREEEGFEIENTEPPATEQTQDTTPEVKVYGYNEMTLDLSKTDGKIGELNAYVSSLTPSKQNAYTGLFAGKNLIFIT